MIKNSNKLKYTIKGLTKGKRYFVRITTYKTVMVDGKPKDIVAMLFEHKIQEEKIKDAYSFTYLIFNVSYLIPRIVCTISYAVGFLLLAIILYHNTLFVINS